MPKIEHVVSKIEMSYLYAYIAFHIYIEEGSVNNMLELWNSTILKVVDKLASIQTKRVRRKYQPSCLHQAFHKQLQFATLYIMIKLHNSMKK